LNVEAICEKRHSPQRFSMFVPSLSWQIDHC
jgi:hypothetical protein